MPRAPRRPRGTGAASWRRCAGRCRGRGRRRVGRRGLRRRRAAARAARASTRSSAATSPSRRAVGGLVGGADVDDDARGAVGDRGALRRCAFARRSVSTSPVAPAGTTTRGAEQARRAGGRAARAATTWCARRSDPRRQRARPARRAGAAPSMRRSAGARRARRRSTPMTADTARALAAEVRADRRAPGGRDARRAVAVRRGRRAMRAQPSRHGDPVRGRLDRAASDGAPRRRSPSSAGMPVSEPAGQARRRRGARATTAPSAASASSTGVRARLERGRSAGARAARRAVGDDEDVYHSIPCWARMPASIGCLTLTTSETRSAASISSGAASRPVIDDVLEARAGRAASRRPRRRRSSPT